MIIIYADQREARSGVLKELDKNKEVDLRIKTLEVGDYVVSDRICFERKTPLDFLQDWIETKELFPKLIDMKIYKCPILLLEGEISELFELRRINPVAVQGCLNTIIYMGISMIETLNASGTAQVLIWFADKEQNGEKRIVQLHGKRSHLTPDQQKIYVLSSIPNIGTSTAISLLRHFGTIQNIITAGLDELMEVDGIGEITANSIRTILTDKFERD